MSLIFYNMKVCCLFSLESPHRGDSNEYTQYTIFNNKKESHRKLSQICSHGIFPRDSRTNSRQPSVFEPVKFYCISIYVDITVRICVTIM